MSLSDLLGQPGKDFYRVRLGVDHIEGKNIHTRFNGYSVLKEHVMRMVRKRTQKIETVMYADTKDMWRLQITAISILNRNTEDSVKKSVRAHMEESIRNLAAKSTIDEFVRSVVNTSMQRGIKKSGTKIYPIRFSEIAKIEVKARPEAKKA